MSNKKFNKEKRDTQKRIGFLTFNSDNKPFYNGTCKLVVNKTIKTLIIQPHDENVKIITASFDSNILAEANILFVDPIPHNHRFALIFNNHKICKKIYDEIYQNKIISKQEINEISFEETYLLPLIQKLDDPQISKILGKFINLCNDEKRNLFIKFFQTKNCSTWIEQNINRRPCLRKRSYVKIKNIPKIKKIEASSPDKIHFPQPQSSKNKHLLYKPDYEIIIDDFQKQRLIIFEPSNKELCYEYYPKKDYFYCAACYMLNRTMVANFRHFGTDKEHVEILDTGHVCNLRRYNRAKFLRQLIYKPLFEFTKVKNNENEKLYIFTNDDQKYCYKFFYYKNGFYCSKCRYKKHKVFAKIFHDKNGIQCIRMGENLHICEPYLYTDILEGTHRSSCNRYKNQERNQELYVTLELKIKSTEFKFVPSELGYTPRLIIFDKKDRSLCYEFSSSSTAFYYCTGCSKLNNNWPNFYAKHHKNEKNGEEFILLKNEKHACKPFKFDPTKYKSPTTVKSENYMFYANFKGVPKMVIYASEDKKLCYNYWLSKRDKIWYCVECARKKKNISAKVRIDLDDLEYVQLGNAPHVCKPLKYSSLKPFMSKIVKSTDVITPLRIEGKGTILTQPYELRPNKSGIKDRILITFISENDKSRCYIYDYKDTSRGFNCRNCIKKKKWISAKIVEKDGKQYIMLGKEKHICQPVQYEKEKIY